MKKLAAFAILLLALTLGCESSPAQEKSFGNYTVSKAVPIQNSDQSITNPTESPEQNLPQDNLSQVVMVPILDKQTGKTSMLVPYPVTWKKQEANSLGDPYIAGPNG